jgi:hypothetical protein
MQATIDIGYDQVFQLAWQLSPRDRERLAKEIVSAEPETIPADTEPRQDLIVLEQHDGFRILQVPFPDTEEGRMRQKRQEELQKQYREKHPERFKPLSQEAIEERRQKLLALLLEGPVATPEDIENQNEFRRLFRWRSM